MRFCSSAVGIWVSRFALCLALLYPPSSHGKAKGIHITISEPATNTNVAPLQSVTGKVSDPTARVWVIIQPRSAPDCWVQNEASVNTDGSWQTEAHFGEPNRHAAEKFLVVAFARPQTELRPGKTPC